MLQEQFQHPERRRIMATMPPSTITTAECSALLLQSCISVVWPEWSSPFGRHSLWTCSAQPESPILPSCTTCDEMEAGLWRKPTSWCFQNNSCTAYLKLPVRSEALGLSKVCVKKFAPRLKTARREDNRMKTRQWGIRIVVGQAAKDAIGLHLPDKFPAKIPSIHSPTTPVTSTRHKVIIAFLLFSAQEENMWYGTFTWEQRKAILVLPSFSDR